jgi:hypothetical protein
MARLGVDYETVKQTAVKLLSQGMARLCKRYEKSWAPAVTPRLPSI